MFTSLITQALIRPPGHQARPTLDDAVWNRLTTGFTPQIITPLTRELQHIQNRQGLVLGTNTDHTDLLRRAAQCALTTTTRCRRPLTFTRQVYQGRRTSTSSGWGPSIFRNRDDQQTFQGSPSQHRRLMRRGEALASVAACPAQQLIWSRL